MGQKKSKQFGPKKLPLDTGGMELWVNHCYPVFCTQGKNLVLVFQHRNRIEQLHRNCCQAKECVLDMQVRRRTVEIGLEHLAERERWDHKKTHRTQSLSPPIPNAPRDPRCHNSYFLHLDDIYKQSSVSSVDHDYTPFTFLTMC